MCSLEPLSLASDSPSLLTRQTLVGCNEYINVIAILSHPIPNIEPSIVQLAME